MISKSILSQFVQFYDKKGNVKEGEVIAIAERANYSRVCIKLQGEDLGQWIEESRLMTTDYNATNLSNKRLAITPTKENFIGESKKEKTIENVTCIVKYIDNKIYAFIVAIVIEVSKELTPILEKITDSWNLYWKERIINTVKDRGFNLEKSKAIVIKIKQQFPTETNHQIAERFITEKSLFITGVSAVKSGLNWMPVVGDIITEISKTYLPFLQIPGLINEMIFQIAYIYGYNYCETDAFLIYNLVFNKPILMKFKLIFLIKPVKDSVEKTFISTWKIDIITTILLSMTVGYATREFYENKTKVLISKDVKEFEKFSTNVEKYVDILLTAKDEIIESFAEFMSDTQPLIEASTVAI